MAMLIQYLSAKAGIATGKSLPELCRYHFPRPVTRGLWVQAEIVAMATDLAEVLGGAIALYLLFDIPLLTGGLITAVAAFALLALQTRGARPFELAITGMLLVILLGFLYSLVAGGVDAGGVASGLAPRFEGTETVLLATGMLGATVMPHVIYLHGALTQNRYVRRTEEQRLGLLRSQRVDVMTAMTVAGVDQPDHARGCGSGPLGNGHPCGHDRGGTRGARGRDSGPTAALLFALALLASGFAASGVGTLSGQIVMQGFLRRRIPLFVRRLITLAPALIVIAAGVDPTQALVISQVVLSFGIPLALIPLVLFTRRRDVMGALVNRRLTTVVATVVAVVISALNVTLIALTVAG